MKVASIDGVPFFVTKDGSTIRELHRTALQSLAEATLEPDEATRRHHHRLSEEIYFVLKGSGTMEVDGDERRIRPGEAVLIPAGAWHSLVNDGSSELRFLCACAPPYRDDDTVFE